MNRKLSLLVPAFALLLPAGAAFADGHAACNDMLATAVGMSLEEEGIDTTSACDLSVSQLAQIKDLLEQDGMGSRAQIEEILASAGQ